MAKKNVICTVANHNWKVIVQRADTPNEEHKVRIENEKTGEAVDRLYKPSGARVIIGRAFNDTPPYNFLADAFMKMKKMVMTEERRKQREQK